jgi:hypothetical protein
MTGLGPDLVVVRGSLAAYEHAPTTARLPHDLDVSWTGYPAAVGGLLRGLARGPVHQVGQVRNLRSSDPRLYRIVRARVTTTLDGAPTASHRFGLDIGISRRVVQSVPPGWRVGAPVRPGGHRVVTLPHLLAEKLWVYLETVRGARSDMRWTDLFDMLALMLGASELQMDGHRHEIRAAAVCYFATRHGRLPRTIPPPPRMWRSAWFNQGGPVTDLAPDLGAAWTAARDFWAPLLRNTAGCGTAWDPVSWTWR